MAFRLNIAKGLILLLVTGASVMLLAAPARAQTYFTIERLAEEYARDPVHRGSQLLPSIWPGLCPLVLEWALEAHSVTTERAAMLHYYAGTCHYHGFEVNRDASAAISHFGQAAELGHAKATSALGMMLEYGVGVAIDRDRAVNLYRLAAEDGELFAAGRLAFFETKQDIELDQGSQSDAR